MIWRADSSRLIEIDLHPNPTPDDVRAALGNPRDVVVFISDEAIVVVDVSPNMSQTLTFRPVS